MDNIPNTGKILFCGLPSSGKTTFLGALSYLTDNDEVEKDFELIGLPEQRLFFQKLSKDWVGCSQMQRTSVASSDKIAMHLQRGDKKIYLEMPDLSGETWQRLWTEHEIDKSLLLELEKTPHIALFIHIDTIVVPMSLDDQLDISGINPTAYSSAPWDPSSHTPTQVIIVDLLRKISGYISSENNKKKLAIVLSAWDTLGKKTVPSKFIENEMPLLHQYLSCKFDFDIVKIFGVSAQGGDISTPEGVDSLLEKNNPSERIKIISDEGEHSDLTKILSWLLDA